ncbi:LapA family protein [Roseivivax sp. CAU 1761]
MRYVKIVILAVLAVVLVSVALANRQMVELRLLPEEMAELLQIQQVLSMPLFFVILLSVVVGLLIGFVWEWMREHTHRSEKARKQEEIARLQRDLRRTEAQRDKNKDEVLALLDRSA